MGKRAQRRRALSEMVKAAKRGLRVRVQFDWVCAVCRKEKTDWCSHSDEGRSKDPTCPFAGLHCEDCCLADWSDLGGN